MLGSSSAGNCTVIWNDYGALMIDCGLSSRYISRHLHALGLSWRSIAGVLITHIHGDHVHPHTVKAIMGAGIPVLCPQPVVVALAADSPAIKKAHERGSLSPLAGMACTVGPFDVQAFEVPHDSRGGCFGYQVFEQTLFHHAKLTLATDIGFPDDRLLMHFVDSHALVVESNHDPTMLENSGRPAWLKQRIRDIGHLSNDQCARFIVDVVQGSHVNPHTVMLAHISRQCNTNALAVQCTEAALAVNGLTGIQVLETFRSRPSAVVSL